jgi:type IV pilus assembly protein PilE
MGILMTIAIPSYQNYLIRSRVQEATSGLSDLRVRMEQYYQDNRNYGSADTAGNCGDGTPTIVFPTTATLTKYFNFTCTPANVRQAYVVTATGVGSMANFVYTINELNVKTSTISAGAPKAWIGTKNNCWITNNGAC